MKLSKEIKYLAAAMDPIKCGCSSAEEASKLGLMPASKSEVALAIKLCSGHYWNQDFDHAYISFSPKGKKRYFSYDDSRDSKVEARWLARLWAKGDSLEGC